MSVTRASLDRFIDRLPALLASDEIVIEKIKVPGRTETNWDTPARQAMKDRFVTWLKGAEDFSEAGINASLFVEGLFGDLPPGARGEFFGSVCCPDMALKANDGYIVAVELDRGSSGSSLRDALTKASFNVIVGGFSRSVVLFFVEVKDEVRHIKKFDSVHPILKLYAERFKTSVLFVTSYEPRP